MEARKCFNCGKEVSLNELKPNAVVNAKIKESWNNIEFRCFPCKLRKDYEDENPERFANIKAFEKRLEEILKIKNRSQTINDLLVSKGYESMNKGFIRGVRVVIYKKGDSDYYGVLRPIQMMVLKVICALGTTTLYKVQKLLSPTYMISNHGIKDALRKLVERHELVQKNGFTRYENGNYIGATYELVEA